MSQEQSKTYLAAAQKAQEASNAALPALASAAGALESAKGARAVLQQTLQNATSEAEKIELSNALKQFDNTVYNPAKTAFDKANANVNRPLQDAAALRQQASAASGAPENSANITPLGNLAAQDATSYPGPDPYYPNEGASGPKEVVQPSPPISSATTPSSGFTPEPVSDSTTYTPAQTNPVGTGQQTVSEPSSQSSTFVRVDNANAPTATAVQPPLQQSSVVNASSESVINSNDPQATRPAVTPGSTVSNAPAVPPTGGVSPTVEQSQIRATEQSDNVYAGTVAARASANMTAVSVSNAKDLRVRISLAKEANYMYKIADPVDILYPLKATNGVIFPYTPSITMNYTAIYDSLDIVHSNYRLHHYKSSGIDSISIIGDFTAQDTYEANYLLAVIHFFKSVTKMFYGKDNNPPNGTPPPLCYLSGYGTYAFDMHPVVIQSFQLSYPNDVNYINAGAGTISGQQLTEYKKPTFPEQRGILARIAGLKSTGVAPGGVSSRNPFVTVSNYAGITRVPTKMTITITALPVVTRNNVSNYFSLKDYATGALLKNTNGYGGMW